MPPRFPPRGYDDIEVPIYLAKFGEDSPELRQWLRDHPHAFVAGTWTAPASEPPVPWNRFGGRNRRRMVPPTPTGDTFKLPDTSTMSVAEFMRIGAAARAENNVSKPKAVDRTRDDPGDSLVQNVQFKPDVPATPAPLGEVLAHLSLGPFDLFIPGTPRNQEWVRGAEGLLHSLRAPRSGGLQDGAKPFDMSDTSGSVAVTPVPPDHPPDEPAVAPTPDPALMPPEDPNEPKPVKPDPTPDLLSRPQRQAIRKLDNITKHGAKDHDFTGVGKEVRGSPTGYDHVQEMRNNAGGLRKVVRSIRGSLNNPNLIAFHRLRLQEELERTLKLLNRMEEALREGS